MRYPIKGESLTVYPTSGEVTPVTVWRDGQDTGELAVDSQGRSSYRLAGAVLMAAGQQADTETSIRVHTEPQGLVSMRPYRLTGDVTLSVWKGRVSLTADGLEEVEA